MPMLIKDPELEAAIERQARAGSVPASKTAFTVAIVRAVLAAADRKKVNARQILDGLMDQDHKPKAA